MAAALVSRAFALAMHERAAWRYDDSRTEHWHHVLGLLPRNHAATPAATSPVTEGETEATSAALKPRNARAHADRNHPASLPLPCRLRGQERTDPPVGIAGDHEPWMIATFVGTTS